jgi:glyoxylase-like metal-dependent hydrolase (beta-lactamase superfamily II)
MPADTSAHPPDIARIVADGVALYDVPPVFAGVAEDILAPLLRGRLGPDGRLPLPYNPLLVDTAHGLVLVDAGAGRELAAEWEDPVGLAEDSLRALGVRPEDIAFVLITHAHADHVGGLTVARGELRVPCYPNARHVLSRLEWAFWLEEEHTTPGRIYLARCAAAQLSVVRDAGLLELVDGETEIARGVHMLPSPGHTPGHMSVAIETGLSEILATGDAVLHEWSFAHPDWTSVTEIDQERAAATRRETLRRAARNASLLHGFHLPALGYVEVAGDAFAFRPA